MSFEDVAGQDLAKLALQEIVILPALRPEVGLRINGERFFSQRSVGSFFFCSFWSVSRISSSPAVYRTAYSSQRTSSVRSARQRQDDAGESEKQEEKRQALMGLISGLFISVCGEDANFTWFVSLTFTYSKEIKWLIIKANCIILQQ